MAPAPQIKASTQEHLEIDEIYDDMVLLKTGGAALVIQTTAVNFGLLSETEQDAIIFAYAGLLNSLSFPIQIVVRSKRMDVSSYLESLIKWEQKQANEKIRIQIKKYREFITSTIRENNVLDKKFYVVIPMFAEELGLGSTSPLSFASGGKKQVKYSKEYTIDRARNTLLPRRDHLMRQLTRLGLKANHLSTQQLIELFYDIYNPSTTGAQRLATRTNEYLSPIVSSSSEIKQVPKPQQKDTLASEMSPTALFGDQNSRTTLVDQPDSTIQKAPVQSTQTQPPYPLNPNPSTKWEQSIQNSQMPWPAPATPPALAQNTPSLTAGTQNPQAQTPPNPWQTNLNPNQQQQQPPTRNPDQVVQNLQKAIEEARRRSSQFNTAQNTQNIPSAGSGLNKNN
jgi:hypothetical protein